MPEKTKLRNVKAQAVNHGHDTYRFEIACGHYIHGASKGAYRNEQTCTEAI